MDTFIMTTFIIIMIFSLINLLSSLTIYVTSKRPLYARIGLFWLFLIVNFFIQSQAQEGELVIILGFGFSIIPLNFLAYASLFFCGAPYPKRVLISLSVLSVLVTLLIKDLSIPFTLKALPFSIASAVPLLYTVYMYFRKRKEKTSGLMMLHGIVLFLFAIHCFNFSFFRMQPAAQLWGWPVAYGLYQLLAMLIPAMTLEFYHNEEKSRLKDEVAKRTKELEEKNRELNFFAKENQMLLNILVHDIATPIQIIMSFSSKLVPEKLPPELLNASERFRRALDSMLETLKTVREYHGARLGKVMPKMKIVSVIDPLRQCILVYEDRMKEKNIKLLVDYNEAKGIYIRTDAAWIKNQIFANILSNAIKFSPPGGEIKISFVLEKNSIKIQFRDYGMGIPVDLREKIFSPNVATSKLGTAGEKGTGLGMPIVKEYLERLEGKIQILSLTSSEPGTCFELEFRVHPQVSTAQAI